MAAAAKPHQAKSDQKWPAQVTEPFCSVAFDPLGFPVLGFAVLVCALVLVALLFLSDTISGVFRSVSLTLKLASKLAASSSLSPLPPSQAE